MRGILEEFIFKDITSIAMTILFGLPILVFLLTGYKKLFKKFNEAEWQVFIPIYNTYILGEIAKVNPIFSLLANSFLIVEIIGFYEYELVFFTISLLGKYIIHYNICKMFNKSSTYALLMSIFPLPMYTILGLSKAKPNIDIKLSKQGPIGYEEPIEIKEEISTEPIIEEPIITEIVEDIKEEKEFSFPIDIPEDVEYELGKTGIYEIPIINKTINVKDDKEIIKEESKEDIIVKEINKVSKANKISKDSKDKKVSKTTKSTKKDKVVKKKVTKKETSNKVRKPRPKALKKNRIKKAKRNSKKK